MLNEIDEQLMDWADVLKSHKLIDKNCYDEIKDSLSCVSADGSEMTREQFISIRKELSLSQAAIGKLLGVSTSAVCKWENGSNKILAPVAVLMRVLSKHGLSVLA